MSRNRILRVMATAAIIFIPLVLAGCASKSQKLANKGFTNIENNKLEEAEKALLDAVKEDPKNCYALVNLGAVYQRTGRNEQAREMFEKVIALDPKTKPPKRSKWVEEWKTLKDMAEDGLKLLPPKA